MAKNLNPIQKRNRINRGLYIVLAVLIVATMLITVIAFSAAKRSSGKTPAESSQSSSNRESSATARPSQTEPEDTAPVDIGLPEDTEAVSHQTGATENTETEGGNVPSAAELVFVMPADGVVAKEFSGEVPVFSTTMNDYRLHTGVDIAAGTGSAVKCAADGTVVNVYNDPLRGVSVLVEHAGGFVSLYQGLADELASGVESGKQLSAGDVIGAVGSTNLLEISEEPHVHFELYKDGATVDPLQYLAAEEAFAYED